jgi:hypothetical protein
VIWLPPDPAERLPDWRRSQREQDVEFNYWLMRFSYHRPIKPRTGR